MMLTVNSVRDQLKSSALSVPTSTNTIIFRSIHVDSMIKRAHHQKSG